jgi:hypothetical protein
LYLAGPGHIGKSALSSIVLEAVSEPVTPDKIAPIDRSRLTNGLPLHLFELLFRVEEIVEKGVQDNRDPPACPSPPRPRMRPGPAPDDQGRAAITREQRQVGQTFFG